MLKKIFSLRKDELVRGSVILFIMINIFNLLNYIFHFSMARMLSIEDYGVLVVLMSFVYVFTIPVEAIQTIISKYTSKFSKNKRKIKDLLLRSMKKAIYVSSILFVLFIPIAFFFSRFLNIDFFLLGLIGLVIFISFISPIVRGVLQGEKKFKKLGMSMDIESLSKILLAIALVYFIKNIYGAVYAIIIAFVISILVSLFFIRNIISEKRMRAKTEGIYSYSWPALILFTVIILMLSLDIILAKRFFSPDIAGKYGVASMLGKMIFFGTSGIGKAMFPITSGMKKKEEKRNILKKSLIIVGGIGLIALIAYLVIPELIVGILFGSKYLEISSIIVYVGLAYAILSITNIMVLHKLSHERIKRPYFMFIFVLAEILLLTLFSQNLLRFVIALIIANLIMLVGVFFIKSIKK